MNSEKKKIVAIGFILVALSYMSIKLSTPALPLLQYQFHTKAFYLKLSGMLYLIFFAFSQLFWGYMFGFTLYVGLMLGYYIAIPYWYMVQFGISDRYYTFLALFTAVPNVFAAYYYARFVIKKHGTKECINFAYLLGVLAAVLGIAFSVWWKSSPVTIILPLVIIAISTGLIQPSINAGLISHFREKAGIVSALIPVFGFGGAGGFFLLLTNISLKTLWPFTWVVIGVVCIGIINRWTLKRIDARL